MQNSMTEIIYDYFTSRIRLGYFIHGDRLPSIQYICRQFQVSALTVRAVFARMQEDGYIKTAERRLSTVTYKPDPQQVQQYRLSFLSRKEGMTDIYQHSDIIFSPITLLYLQKQNAESIRQIRSQLKKRKGFPARQITMFYAEAMQPLNNPLILNLLWEMVRYLQMPYLQQSANFDDKAAQSEAYINQMLSLIEAGNTEKAVELMHTFNRDVTQMFFQGISVTFDAEPPAAQIPFKWQIYREHPQLCYTLAAELMSRIDGHFYSPDEFLPSCQSLAQEYDVSLITMRRTLKLLSDICVTETLNGLGTKVAHGTHANTPDFNHLHIRKSLLLYLQALQVCSLTCSNVAIHTLSSLDSIGIQLLSLKIRQNMERQTSYFVIGSCLKFIGEHSPSAFIQEVYRQLYHLLLWGHALHIFYQNPESSALYETYSSRLLDSLQRLDIPAFAGHLSQIAKIALQTSRELLLKLGFTESQLL